MWYMAHDMEKYASASPEVMAPAVPAWYPESGDPISDRPEWLEARPPFNPDSRIEVVWSNVMTPIRSGTLAFMWLTYKWYRAGIVVAGMALLIVLIVQR
jgi:hypothetical protein